MLLVSAKCATPELNPERLSINLWLLAFTCLFTGVVGWMVYRYPIQGEVPVAMLILAAFITLLVLKDSL